MQDVSLPHPPPVTPRALRALATLLPLPLLIACGAAPPMPVAPTASPTPEARAEACLAATEAAPADHAAQACLRDALTRLGRHAELVGLLREGMAARPDDALARYFLARALVRPAPAEAAAALDACAERAPTSPWCPFGRAVAAYEAGRPGEALDRVLRARARTPREPEIAALEAQIRAALDEVGRARLLIEDLIARAPDSPPVQLAASAVRLAAGDAEGARTAAIEAARRAPDAAEPPEAQARVALLLGDDLGAARLLQAAVAADPAFARPRRALAHLQLSLGRAETAIDHLEVLRRAAPDDPVTARTLGVALLQAGDAQRALAWADAALTAAPEDREALTLRARALIQLGEIEAGLSLRPLLYGDPVDGPARRVAVAEALDAAGDGARAEAEFAAGVAAHPDDARLWRAYGLWTVGEGQLQRGASLLRQGTRAAPGDPTLHAILADVLERLEDVDGARAARMEAARLAPDDPDHPDEVARLDLRAGHTDRALARWHAVVDRFPGAERALQRLADAYRDLDRPAEAIPVLERLRARRPDDAEVRAKLGETLLMVRRKAPAVEHLRAALDAGADPRRYRPLLATALADTGQLEAAEALFAAALADDPGNRPLRLTFAAFREMRGDRDGAAALYRDQLARDPTDTDARAGLSRTLGAEAAAAALAAGSVGAAEADPTLRALAARVPAGDTRMGTVLRDERYVTVDARGVAAVRHVRSVLVQHPAGVERYGVARVPFHADHPPTVVRARTLTPDGASVDVPDAHRGVDDPYAGTPLRGDARQLRLEFQRVEPGAIVDYEVVSPRPHPDVVGAWWDAYVLGNADPTVQARYVLDLPAAAPRHVRARGMPPPREALNDGRRVLTWEATGLPAYRPEDAARAAVPAVQAASVASWREVDAWYHALFAPRSQPSPTVAARAKALTRGLKDRRARVAAVYAFVEQHVRYLGIEFGIGAYQPRPADGTLAQARGDCKDMTALMVAMLDAIGIEAHPALIRPADQGPFDAEHPSPGQFSHVLLYVPDAGGDLWLDATAGLGTLTAVPSVLRGQPALVVDGRGGALRTVPVGDADDHRMVETVTYDLTGTGGGRLRSALHLEGDLAGSLRQRLAPLEADARDLLLRAPGFLLGDERQPAEVTLTGVDDPRAPLEVQSWEESSDLVALRLDGALVVPFGLALFTRGPLHALGPGAHLATPRVFERRLVLRPPPGYRFDWAPVRHRVEQGPVAFTVEEHREDGQTTLVSRMRINAPRGGADDQDDLMAVAREVRDALEQPLAMRPGADFDRVALLGAVVQERPDDARLKMLLGRTLLDGGRVHEAVDVLGEAADAAPDDPAIQSLLITALLRADDPKRAEEPLRRLAARADAPPEVFRLLAAMLMEDQRPGAAVDVLQAGRARHPEDTGLARRLASALADQGKPRQALQIARDLVAARPEDGAMHALLGDVANEIGDRPAAVAAYRDALRLAPDQPTVLNNLAWTLRDDPAAMEEALALATRAVMLDPQSDSAWDTLAELRWRAGDAAAAIEAIERALAIDSAQRALYQQRLEKYQTDAPPGR